MSASKEPLVRQADPVTIALFATPGLPYARMSVWCAGLKGNWPEGEVRLRSCSQGVNLACSRRSAVGEKCDWVGAEKSNIRVRPTPHNEHEGVRLTTSKQLT